jgi:hypothetical protein
MSEDEEYVPIGPEEEEAEEDRHMTRLEKLMKRAVDLTPPNMDDDFRNLKNMQDQYEKWKSGRSQEEWFPLLLPQVVSAKLGKTSAASSSTSKNVKDDDVPAGKKEKATKRKASAPPPINRSSKKQK